MPKGRSGLPHSKTLREISEHYKQTPAFGVRWEAERHTAFLRRKSEREEKRRRRFALPAQSKILRVRREMSGRNWMRSSMAGHHASLLRACILRARYPRFPCVRHDRRRDFAQRLQAGTVCG